MPVPVRAPRVRSPHGPGAPDLRRAPVACGPRFLLPFPHAAVARGPRRRKPGYPIVALVSRALDAAETSGAGAEQRALPYPTWPRVRRSACCACDYWWQWNVSKVTAFRR